MDSVMKISSGLLLLLVSLVLGSPTGHAQNSVANDKTEVVQKFLDAFNEQDATAMAVFVTDEIKWLSVSGPSISIEVEGKAAFIDAMEEYFTSCPTCRSKIHNLMSSGERVSAVEVASWIGPNGRRAQQSMAVYEFSGSLIRSVYYFPEEPVHSQTGAD